MKLDQWLWMMEYCRKRCIPSAQAWAWTEAKKAHQEFVVLRQMFLMARRVGR